MHDLFMLMSSNRRIVFGRYMMRLEKEFLKMRSTTAKELSELEALKRAQEDLNAKNTKLADKVAQLSKENCRLTRDINNSKVV